MESLDPPKNIANVGTSRRRISSILKAPRTSVHFPDPEHVESPDESTMPVEKRNSRRVSFAPATNVLLFSKETRNGSPVQSLPQDLSDAITSDNRNSIGIIGNGIQPITDMETLLNAPLHSSQQRKKVFMVSHGAEDDCGEKTVMFSADDAAMDVTHSHTMFIDNDSDLPAQHGEVFSPCGNMDFFFSTDRGKAEPCILPKTTSSSVHTFDPEFENLLASFSKPSRPRDNSMLHKVEQNTPMTPHDKENHAPTSMSTKRENLPHKITVKIGESSNGGAVLSEDTQSMNMTDVFTGRIGANATSEAPLQCLFPPMDLYRQSEHRKPAERNGQKFFEAPKCSMSNPNDTRITTKISVADSKKCRVGVPSLQMGNSLNLNLPQMYPLPEPRMISQNKSAQHVLGLEEYANRNTSESDDMDMTRSQTVAIDSRSLRAVATAKQKQEISRFSIIAPDKTSTDFEDDLDFTRCQTGVMISQNKNAQHVLGLEEYANRNTPESDDMDMTRSQTVAIDSRSLRAVATAKQKQEISRFSIIAPDKTSTDFEDDLDFTRCQTGVMISQNKNAQHVLGLEEYANRNTPECDDMDMTRSQTVAIDSRSLRAVATAKQKQEISRFSIIAPDKTCTDFEDDLDFTRCQTGVMISQNKNAQHVLGLEEYANRNTPESDDMDMTRSQTVAIDSRSLRAVATAKQKQEISRFSSTAPDKTCTDFEDDLDFTRCQTGVIEAKNLNVGKPSLTVNAGGSVRIMADSQRDWVVNQETITIDNMEITQCQTAAIGSLHGVKPSQIKQMSQDIVAHGTKWNNPSEDDNDMEFTTCHTRVFESKDIDVPVGHVGILGMNKALGVEDKVNRKPSQTEVSKYYDSKSDDIEITRSQTVSIDTKTPNEASSMLQDKKHASMAFFSAFTKACTQNTSQDEYGMEMTQTHTNALICSENVDEMDGGNSRQEGFEHSNFESDDMELTSQTVAIDERNLNALNPSDSKSQKSLAFKTTSDHKSQSSGLSMPDKHLGNGSLSCGLESASNLNAAVDRDDKTSSTRRMSLADLQLKLRATCHLLNEPTEKFAVDYTDATLSQPKSASDGISDKTQLTAPLHNPETQMIVDTDYTQPEQLAEEDQPCVTAPLNLKRKSLTARLSLGNVLPKLPQKIKPVNSNKEHKSKIILFNVTHQLSSGLTDDIGDEVPPNTSMDEDSSESLVPEEPQSTSEDGSPLRERDVQGMTGEDLWELSPGHLGGAQSKKRPSPVDGEATMATEKRRRPSLNSTIEMPNQSPEKERCSIVTLAPAVMAQAAAVSNSSNTVHLGSETTFESTLKQSLFESQLEDVQDFTNDFQKNVDDERITVSAFFKLFNLDFVIHNPRQSILPGKLASHLDQSPVDLLKNRHINHPKQKVYELDHQSLAEKVERLRARMKDQVRLLHSVNKPLWEELTCLSEEEMECFGAKLKESSNFFRKRSKAQSDEMKEALYSNLRQANLDEQQKLREKTEEVDGMLRSLDDCIWELEAELAAVEGSGLDDGKTTLKSSQLELENVAAELADKERQMLEMQIQKKCNMDQVKKLQRGTQDLNDHITLLHRVNEWKVAERRANSHVYSFLYESLCLEVVFHTRAGKGLEEDDERNISAINFKLELDGEKSACHARLVHTLLSEFHGGQSDWLGKYPSKRYVPKLLHDVSLVVSRCRLLGEEVRLLKTWGSLQFDILDIACVDTSVHIVFSSLEAMAMFELSLAVTKDYPCCPLQMQRFRSHIGSTTAHRIEEVVSSVSPGKNYLTKIVKAIHAALLS